jgi:1,4-alpha-glucan branching enzyme
LTGYPVPMPRDGDWLEIFNSDSTVYSGSGKGNLGKVTTTRSEDGRAIAELTLPPLATLMFKPG